MSYGQENSGTETLGVFLLIVVGLFSLIGLFAFFGSFGTVDTGYRGVVIHLGNPTGEIKDQGFYWKAPFITDVVEMSVQVQKTEVEASAASRDLQDVTTKVALNYRLDPASVGTLYQDVRKDYDIKLVQPRLQESIKAATSQYTAEELVTKRSEVRDKIEMNLRDKLLSYGLIVDQVNIVDFSFSPSFNAAIEKKVTAEQDALAAKNKLEQIKFEAQQTIESAKAQAESIKIQAEAVNSQGGADYVSLQAIQKWDGQLPTQMIPGSSVPFINVTK